jgi:hypothetical protein
MELTRDDEAGILLIIDAYCVIKSLLNNKNKTQHEEEFIKEITTKANFDYQQILDGCYKYGYEIKPTKNFFRLAKIVTRALTNINQEWKNYLLMTTDSEDQSLALLLKKILMKQCSLCEQEFIPTNKKFNDCLECREDSEEEL